MDVESLRNRLSAHGQEHLLKFWKLDLIKNGGLEKGEGTIDEGGVITPDMKRFLEELAALDFEKIMEYFNTCTEEMKSGRKLDEWIEPLPQDVVCRAQDLTLDQLRKYEEIGLREVSEGRVAVLLLAGGQGTRLGVSYPKGMYDLDLPSGKTLYQIQAERIRKVQQMATNFSQKPTATIPWYIMTSEHTQEETEKFFKSHNYFSLSPDNIIFFEQNTLPCMTYDGKIILESPYKISRAPDGNGGLYKALEDRGILSDMSRRGVQYIHVYCVDNILVRLADPTFIGHCVDKQLQCAAKVVEKVDPAEPVGVVCAVRGKESTTDGHKTYQVIEYSEISRDSSELREGEESSRLLYWAGGIANHFITTQFLEHIVREKEAQLKHHVAKKKIPFCDDDGNLVKPASPNGIKMEKFVFDIYPFAQRFGVWEVVRGEEFSPLKNADGSAPTDTPTTSRHALLSLHGRWVRQAGGQISDGDKELCEISPLLSYAGEGLERVSGRTFPALSHIDETSLSCHNSTVN